MKRDEQRQRTRDALLPAAAIEFEDRGYYATTLADIAARLGLVRATVHFHFATKEGLARALVESVNDQWLPIRAMDAADDRDAITRLRSAAIAVGHRWLRDPRVRAAGRLGGESVMSRGSEPAQPWIDFVQILLAEGRRDGSIRASIEPKSDAPLVVAMMEGVLRRLPVEPRDVAERCLARSLALMCDTMSAQPSAEASG